MPKFALWKGGVIVNCQRLLSAEEVAELLGVRLHRVYELARANILPSVRLGRQIRFSPEQLQEFIRSGGQSLPGGWKHEA